VHRGGERRLLALTLLLASAVANATTYRWVDANGVTHYSDQPQPGATKIELPQAQTYSSGSGPKAPAASNPAASNEQTQTGVAAAVAPPMSGPTGCTITAPLDEQVFVNTYSVSVTAKGPVGGEIRLLLDGGLKQKGTTPEFLLNPIDRGMHTAIVVFASAGGGELCRTHPVTFYVRKPTLIRPPKGKH
jgi:hypothetical protein